MLLSSPPKRRRSNTSNALPLSPERPAIHENLYHQRQSPRLLTPRRTAAGASPRARGENDVSSFNASDIRAPVRGHDPARREREERQSGSASAENAFARIMGQRNSHAKANGGAIAQQSNEAQKAQGHPSDASVSNTGKRSEQVFDTGTFAFDLDTAFEEPDLPPLAGQVNRRSTSLASFEKPLRETNIEPLNPQSESLHHQTTTQPEQVSSKNMRIKRKRRDDAAAQLSRLKVEISRLDDMARKFQSPEASIDPNDPLIDEFMSLASTNNPACAPLKAKRRTPFSSVLSGLLPFSFTQLANNDAAESESDGRRSSSPIPTDPYALEAPEEPLPYITRFGPLMLSYDMLVLVPVPPAPSSFLDDSATETLERPFQRQYKVTLSPPVPFPKQAYLVPVTFIIDPMDKQVVSIDVSDPSPSAAHSVSYDLPSMTSNIPRPLLNWMSDRLSSSNFGRDVSGLFWGVCQYWEAMLMRAKIWVSLDELRQSISQNNKAMLPEQQNEDFSPRRLVPHLSRTSITITRNGNQRQRTSSAPSSALRLLVTCNISLDSWTSEARLEPELSVYTPLPNAARIEVGARQMFTSLLRERTGASGSSEDGVGLSADSVCRAVEAVAKVLFAP